MFEYRNGRFVDPGRITTANIYQKDGEIRVAMDLDVLDTNNKTVYSDTMPSMDEARKYCLNLPVQNK